MPLTARHDETLRPYLQPYGPWKASFRPFRVQPVPEPAVIYGAVTQLESLGYEAFGFLTGGSIGVLAVANTRNTQKLDADVTRIVSELPPKRGVCGSFRSDDGVALCEFTSFEQDRGKPGFRLFECEVPASCLEQLWTLSDEGSLILNFGRSDQRASLDGPEPGFRTIAATTKIWGTFYPTK